MTTEIDKRKLSGRVWKQVLVFMLFVPVVFILMSMWADSIFTRISSFAEFVAYLKHTITDIWWILLIGLIAGSLGLYRRLKKLSMSENPHKLIIGEDGVQLFFDHRMFRGSHHFSWDEITAVERNKNSVILCTDQPKKTIQHISNKRHKYHIFDMYVADIDDIYNQSTHAYTVNLNS